ncbi:MAG: class B sortase [Clostridiales bacterium]|nr:class B sortase [Clostridiales bacterium]
MKLSDILNKLKNLANRNPGKASADDNTNIYELNEVKRDEDSDPFLHSLKTLTPDDIAPKPQKKSDPIGVAIELFRKAVIVVCVCVFIGSGATLVRSFVDYKRGDDLYGEIAGSIFDVDLSAGMHAVSLASQSRPSPSTPDYYSGLEIDDDLLDDDYSSSYNVKFETMKSNLNYLKTMVNPDIFGYIKVDGTKIDLPIVQTTDNKHYLDYSYTGEYMVVGSIFADFRANRNMDYNRNTVFYGHNMNNGSMFNNVMLFLDEEFFNNTLIEIYTFDGIYTYEPFAIFDTVSTYQYFRMYFQNDDDFISFCNEMQSKSRFNKNMTFTGDDQVITLSTCTNVGDGRYALHAKLVKVER